jgi:hypothetical protein
VEHIVGSGEVETRAAGFQADQEDVAVAGLEGRPVKKTMTFQTQ